jgi:5-carboxymethyl-2-hydroxymuconate isomerase
VTPEEAMDCVAGYVVVNDVSARDWQGNPQALAEGQKGDGQWLRAKGSDTFLPVGPVMVTPDEVDPVAGLRLRSWIIHDGQKIPMQDGNTRDLMVDVPNLVSLASQEVTLEPADLLITGTPAGVGVFRTPPVFLRPGDRVRCEVEGIGSVENPIVDWTEDPRQRD